MLAVKPRHTDTPARPAARPSDSVRIVGAPHRPRTSPPREMRDMLEARLATPAVVAPQSQFSPGAKIGIVAALATAAWMPIAAAVYAFSL